MFVFNCTRSSTKSTKKSKERQADGDNQLPSPHSSTSSRSSSTSSADNSGSNTQKKSPKGNDDASKTKKKKECSWIPTSDDKLSAAEQKLLQPIEHLITRQSFVAGINTVTFESPQQEDSTRRPFHIVLIHGFGGGLATWAQQWETLTKLGVSVHAVDLPGFGRNSRPELAGTGEDKRQTFQEALGYMLSQLNNWYDAMAFDAPVVLIGHSFGAYVASQLARSRVSNIGTVEGEPSSNWQAGDVAHIILCDPWGVAPFQRKIPKILKSILKLVRKTSPLGILRAVGPLGPKLFRKIRPDFADRWREFLADPNDFYDYIYHCNAQYPTGEKVFMACVTPKLQPCEPIQEFFADVVARSCQGGKGMHVSLLYGQNTWMNKEAAIELQDSIRAKGCVIDQSDDDSLPPRGTSPTRPTTKMTLHYDEVSNAAHQLNTDNAIEFNQKVRDAIRFTGLMQASC